MNRRDAFRYLAVLSGGLFLVPSCDFTREEVMLAYDNLKISEEDKAILQKLCNTIIPSDAEFQGADELHLSDFVLVMIDDCYNMEDQKAFTEGLKKLSQYAYEQTRQNFLSLSQQHAEEMIIGILEHPEIEEENTDRQEAIDFEDIRYCVQTTRSLTIQGYMASEYIMTEVMPYQLVPGPFQGKVPVIENERINVNG